MTNHSLCLLDDAASFMKVQYLSDLRFLCAKERGQLAAFLEGLEATKYTLFQWNDAVEYLQAGSPQQSIRAARKKLLQALSSR